MKISYISADFGVPIWGDRGASIHLRETVAAWCRAGHAVWVISPTAGEQGGVGEGVKEQNDARGKNTVVSYFPSGANELEDATFVSILPSTPYPRVFQDLEALDKSWGIKARFAPELRCMLYNLTLYGRAFDYLQSWRIDCIYERYSLLGCAGIRLAKALGVPHLLEVNAPLGFEQEKLQGPEMSASARETEYRLFLETNQVIVVSRQLQTYVAACGVPLERISILPNAVDPQRFDPRHENNDMSVRNRYKLEGKYVIGFVGGLAPWHGVDTLIVAFRRLLAVVPHARLLIVGDGPEREKLEKYALENDLNGMATFTGLVPYDAIPQYIAAMDIAVAPYKPSANFYHSPLPLFEYMAMGKPVVAGSIGQIQEVIKNGENGLLYAPGNIAQLATTLSKLADNAPPLGFRLGENARTWVQKERTWEKNAQQLAKMASKLIKKRSNVTPAA